MKPLHKILTGLLSCILLLPGYKAFAQDAQKNKLSIAVSYLLDNNQIPYVTAKVKSKIDGRFKMVSGIPLKLYINKDSAGNLIACVVTDDKGEAIASIPPALKNQWGTLPGHTFVATFDGNKKFEAAEGDATVVKAKIVMDTTGDKKIIATVYEMKDSAWQPVKGVDVIVAIKRLYAVLNANETATFTTDSTGKASADFKRDSINGDANGNITIIAKVEDNDQYGSLSVEKNVPWGAKFIPVSEFGKRSLFATSSKAPIWLILMATSIIVAVWGILAGLVVNLFKIKKLGQKL